MTVHRFNFGKCTVTRLPAIAAAQRAGRSLHLFKVAVLQPGDRALHRRRCPVCRPYSNPRPLPISGAAYRRRTRARSRR